MNDADAIAMATVVDDLEMRLETTTKENERLREENHNLQCSLDMLRSAIDSTVGGQAP